MEDQEKLRKRQREHDQPDANGQSKSKARSAAGVKATTAVVPPNKEELEEFFAILRRMHVAIRYFDQKINVDGDGDRGGRFSGKLREALETGRIESVTPTTSEGDHGNGHVQVDDAEAPATKKSCLIDLNSEPDQEIVELAAANTGP